MSKILVLAETGFGKSISASGCQEPDLGIDIEGLPRESTYFISATSKPLPFRGSQLVYPTVVPDATLSNLDLGRRVITNDGYMVAKVLNMLMQKPWVLDIVMDDVQYWMQDFMMEKSLATGWDAPKKAGHFMSQIFASMEMAEQWGKNTWMLAHYEGVKKDATGALEYKMRTTGNTIGNNINPEGKFDVTLYGLVEANPRVKKVTRYYITNHNGTYPAKSAPGMLPQVIPNDLAFVKKCLVAYYNGQPTPQVPADFKEVILSTTAAPVAAAVANPALPATNGVAEIPEETPVAPPAPVPGGEVVQAAPVPTNPASSNW